jgi:hypothetical protein
MNKKELFKQLNQLCISLNSTYNINCGGCCYVAACLAEQLEKYNISFEIIHYNRYNCHYAIKVSDRYLNRDYYKKREITEILNCSSKQLFNVYYENNWNSTYKIHFNDTVKQAIIKLFDKYENSRTRFHNGKVK